MHFVLRKKTYRADTFAELSALYSKGTGVSRTTSPIVEIVDDEGNKIARISPNGKVWRLSDDKLLYNPWDE